MLSRTRVPFLLCVAAYALSFMAGCSTLPDSGPSAGKIADGANDSGHMKYIFVDVDEKIVDTLKTRTQDGFSETFGDYAIGKEPPIGIGDSVSVTIWEASAGGLFSQGQAGDKLSASSNAANIPEQIVARDGAITVPFAGRIKVAGRVPRDVQKTIETALAGKAVDPQVLVTVTHTVNNVVNVEGDVTTAGRIPLSLKGDRILEILPAAGGVRDPANEVLVELTRGAATKKMLLRAIIDNPKENIYLHPGDTLTLVHQPESFVAYGAAGRDAQIPFESDHVTLAEAIGKANGLNDARSDPTGVFVFRNENVASANALQPDVAPAAKAQAGKGKTIPVVYHFDMSSPDAMFLQQHFMIADGDILYVSNSTSTALQKVFEIISPGIGIGSSALSIANTATTIH